MTKSKTNALEALRALIAERQQYEQWIGALESKREGTPPHVFERVQNDYNTRLQRVVGEIKGHAEELQLSISTLSNRLVEVARDEDTKRDALQEAELRATVGEYEPARWAQLKSEAEHELEKIAADRSRLDSELGELRSIQKLSEVGSTGSVEPVDFAEPQKAAEEPVSAQPDVEEWRGPNVETPPERAPEPEPIVSTYSAPTATPTPAPAPAAAAPSMRDQGNFPLEDAAAASAAVLSSPPPVPTAAPSASGSSGAEPAQAAGSNSSNRGRSGKTPPFGSPGARKTPERTDQAKTLKCPECGTANYPTEWYCERCGGELATM